MRYDFHSHTHYSDGILSPKELIDRAESKQLDLLAITDHDSISGLQEAGLQVKSRALNVKLINGIEFSALSDFGEIHIVGLNINTNNTELLNVIKSQISKRWQRAEKIDAKLKKLHVDGVLNQLKLTCKEVVTRSHVAKALIELGYAKDNNQAFKKYLGKKGRAKVSCDWISMQETIACIQAAGGLAVLAHPTRYSMSNRRLSYLIEEYKIAGGDAIELAYPSLSPDKRGWLEVQRKENDLLASGGSDFHYPDLKWSDLGYFPIIDSKIPHVLDKIKDKLQFID